MKKILSVILLLTLSVTMSAQKNVTKFLGIPVDGTKSAMIQKLKEKGFTYNSTLDCLEGEFNGYDVTVYVVTNNNKVWRIMVADDIRINEADIKIRFNNLCRQFESNSKYRSATLASQIIPDEDDISYKMMVDNKRYEAVYYQNSGTEEMDENEGLFDFMMRAVWFMITERYGRYYIAMYYDNVYNRSDGEDL